MINGPFSLSATTTRHISDPDSKSFFKIRSAKLCLEQSSREGLAFWKMAGAKSKEVGVR